MRYPHEGIDVHGTNIDAFGASADFYVELLQAVLGKIFFAE